MSTENKIPKVGDLVQITNTKYCGVLEKALLSNKFRVDSLEVHLNNIIGFHLLVDGEAWYFSPTADKWHIVEEKS